MRKDLQKKLESIDETKENYFEISDGLRKKYLSKIVQKLNQKKAFEAWKVNEEEFSSLFDEIIDDQKKKALTKLKNSTIEKLRQHCEDLFTNSLETYSKEKDFWKDVNENYVNHFSLKMFPLRVYLKQNYNCENEEISEMCNSIQEKIYEDTKKKYR